MLAAGATATMGNVLEPYLDLTPHVEVFTQRLLHNDTAFAIQRRLQFSGLQTVVLPIRAT